LTIQTKSTFFAIISVLLWSTVATAFKITLQGVSATELLFYASLTSTFIFAIAIKIKKISLQNVLFEKTTLFRNILLGLINPFLYYLVLFKAYDLLPAQEAQPLNYTWPIAISIFSSIFLKTKISWVTILGLLISFLGVLIIATHGNILGFQFHNVFGTILAVGSSLIWATFWILNIKDSRKDEIKLFSAFFWGTIFTFLYILAFDSLSFPKLNYLFATIYIGFFEMGITFLLWLKALNLSSDKAKTSAIAYFSPFLSMLFIAIILEETIIFSSILGLFLIVGGILVQNLVQFVKIFKKKNELISKDLY